jgi:hypothetical protein
MNYQKHYENLINRAKNRIYTGHEYVEKHHILPRCMGGTNDSNNLVNLLAREHFIAHQLLVRIYPSIPGLVYALIKMSAGKGYHKGRTNNRLYEWIKRKNNILKSETKKGKPWPNARRRAYENNKPTQPESANIIRREKMTGIKNSTGMLGKSHSQETKLKMSLSQTGKMKNSTRAVYAWINSPTGEEILFGPLLHECTKYYLTLDYISDLCKGKKKLYKGWSFIRYATNEEKANKIQMLQEQGLMF